MGDRNVLYLDWVVITGVNTFVEKVNHMTVIVCKLYCVDNNKLENSERDVNTRPPDLPLEKSVYRSGSNS